jgi:cadmium resistance transport/sequestration family protein
MGSIGTGITAFVATNIDDLVLLTLFFGRTNASFRPRHVVSGSYLGLLTLVGISLLGSLGRLVLAPAWIGLLGLVPIGLGIRQLRSGDNDDGDNDENELDWGDHGVPKRGIGSVLRRAIAPQCYQVAAVTIANGGDNIGIYTPLFASSEVSELLIILAVFFVGMGCWCYGAYRLANHPKLAKLLARYGQSIVPIILIGLGLFILWENGTIGLFLR